MHLVDGMGPRRDNPVVQGLLRLAAEFNVPVNIHTDSSRHGYLLPICRQHSKVRFIWAHAGGVLGPGEVGKLMQACPNVWVELSARDPWHYGGITDNGRLLPEWRALFKRYPTRFMIGTDPVWNAHQTYRWYEADEGWFHYPKLIGYHRRWLKQLPTALARKIRIDNARSFFSYALKPQ
jgi:predicted TIM-barrel fold metal-dependent hydrolase